MGSETQMGREMVQGSVDKCRRKGGMDVVRIGGQGGEKTGDYYCVEKRSLKTIRNISNLESR